MAIFRTNRRVVAVDGNLLPREDSFHKAEVEFLRDVHTKREYKAFIEHLSETDSVDDNSSTKTGSSTKAHVEILNKPMASTKPSASTKPALEPTCQPAPLHLKDVKTYGDYKAFLKSLNTNNSKNKTNSKLAEKPSSKPAPVYLKDVKTYGDYKAYLRSLSSNQSQSREKVRTPRKDVPGRVTRFLNPPTFIKRHHH